MKRNILPAMLLVATTFLTACGTSSPLLSNLSQPVQSDPNNSTPATTTNTQSPDLISAGIEKLLGSLLGGSTLNQESIIGTWYYKGADCVFKT